MSLANFLLANHIKTSVEFIAASAALVAAFYWRKASKQPVAKYAPAGLDVTSAMLKRANDKIEHGAKLKSWAATAAAVSAVAQAIALLMPDK